MTEIGLEEKEIEEIKKKTEKIKIIKESGFYHDLKAILKLITIIITITIILYVLYIFFEWYFWLDFLISLPIAFFIASRLLKIKYHHVLILDLDNNKIHYIRLAKSYRIDGKYVILNSDTQVFIAEKITIKKLRKRAILDSLIIYGKDKWKFLVDSKVVDNAINLNEQLTIRYYRLRKLFINKLLRLFRAIQEQNLVEAIKMLKSELEKEKEIDIKENKEVIEIE